MPRKPWVEVHLDLYELLPNGEMILGIIDDTTRWPEIFFFRRATSTNVIRCLEQLFATWGNPETIITDNGSQFTSEEFRTYVKSIGTRLRLVTPY